MGVRGVILPLNAICSEQKDHVISRRAHGERFGSNAAAASWHPRLHVRGYTLRAGEKPEHRAATQNNGVRPATGASPTGNFISQLRFFGIVSSFDARACSHDS